jgi:hypothetical protein
MMQAIAEGVEQNAGAVAKREAIRGAQRYSDTAAMFGARVAETISASGHGDRTNRPDT